MEEQKQEAPVLPVVSGTSSPEATGVSVKVDQDWQVSHMPEEKQYFSQDVSFYFQTLHTSVVNHSLFF